MKFNYKDFSKKIHAIGRGSDFNPHRDWKILLVFFVVVNVWGALLCSYMFVKISRGQFFKEETQNTVPIDTIDRVGLRALIDYYDGKKHDLLVPSQSTVAHIDPSL